MESHSKEQHRVTNSFSTKPNTNELDSSTTEAQCFKSNLRKTETELSHLKITKKLNYFHVVKNKICNCILFFHVARFATNNRATRRSKIRMLEEILNGRAFAWMKLKTLLHCVEEILIVALGKVDGGVGITDHSDLLPHVRHVLERSSSIDQVIQNATQRPNIRFSTNLHED